MTALPSYEQILQLPAQFVRPVPAEFIDRNGHMNIIHYMELGAAGLGVRWQEDFGMDSAYVTDRHMSSFTTQHHLQYHSELLEGEEVSVHARVLDRSDKVLHITVLIVNRTRERLACTMEILLVHVDLTSRRATPFPPDIAARLDASIAADAVNWPAPVCGVMGIRRRD